MREEGIREPPRVVPIERVLQITLPARQSAFLWGPRKTGKSTYLRSAFSGSLRFDLLHTDLMLELTKRPALLRERLLATRRRICGLR